MHSSDTSTKNFREIGRAISTFFRLPIPNNKQNKSIHQQTRKKIPVLSLYAISAFLIVLYSSLGNRDTFYTCPGSLLLLDSHTEKKFVKVL